MVSYTDYPRRNGLAGSHDAATERPRKRRFRLFAAFAAPFQDMDERAVHKKHERTDVRNKSKGNLFVNNAAVPATVSVKRFPRGDD